MSDCQRCGGVKRVAGNRMTDYEPPLRLLEAFKCGEVTIGGLAEAGWLPAGRLANGSLVLIRGGKAGDE